MKTKGLTILLIFIGFHFSISLTSYGIQQRTNEIPDFRWLRKSEKNSTLPSDYNLSRKKCNRNRRTRIICKMLLKSKKFRRTKKHSTTTTTSTTPTTSTRTELSFESGYVNEKKREQKESSFEMTEKRQYPVDFYRKSQIRKYPSLTRVNKKRSSYLRNLRVPFDRGSKFVSEKVSNVKDVLSDLPLAVTGIPFFSMLGVALLLRYHLRSRMMSEMMLMEEAKMKMEPKKPSTEDKLKLANQILSITSESINLASNKLSLINILGRTAISFGFPFAPNSFLASQKLKVNSTLVNNIAALREDNNGSSVNMTNLVGEFLKVISEQVIQNATSSIINSKIT